MNYLACEGYTKRELAKAFHVFRGTERPAISILWRSFNSKRPICLKTFIRKYRHRNPIIEIHATNEAGRRNNRLAKYEYLASLSVNELNRRIETRDKRTLSKYSILIQNILNAVAPILGQAEVIISTGLEDNYTHKAAKIITKYFRERLPDDIKVVRNPVSHNKGKYFADYIELHGMYPEYAKRDPCISSLDGTDIDYDDGGRADKSGISLSQVRGYIKREAKRGCYVFLWWQEQQGITHNGFVEPRSRSFSIDSEVINVIRKLMEIKK